jgi:hypothetical protein
MKKYVPCPRVVKHKSGDYSLHKPEDTPKLITIRKPLFQSLEQQERYYHGNIPADAIKRTLKKHGLKGKDTGEKWKDKEGHVFHNYDLVGKHGKVHAELSISPTTKKVNVWRVL